MKKEIENVLQDFINQTKKSWSYGVLTDEEKEQLSETFAHVSIKNALRGTYEQRFDILNAIYYAFLQGVGFKKILERSDSIRWQFKMTKEMMAREIVRYPLYEPHYCHSKNYCKYNEEAEIEWLCKTFKKQQLEEMYNSMNFLILQLYGQKPLV